MTSPRTLLRSPRRRRIAAVAPALALAAGLAAGIAVAFAAEEPDWTRIETQLRAAAQENNAAALRLGIHQLAPHPGPKATELLIKYTLYGGSLDVELAAGRVLALTADAESRKLIHAEANKHKNPKTRIVLLGVCAYQFGKDKDDGAFQALVNGVKDPAKEVLLTALRWLRDTGDVRAVDALIRELDTWERRPHGRIYFDIRKALQQITRQDFDAAADWRNYWEARKAGAPPPSTATGRTKRMSRGFFSVTIDSDRVLFIIDISQSMTRKDQPPEKTESEEKKPDGRTVVVRPKKKAEKKEIPQEELPIERERLYRVKKELVSTIESLAEHIFFTVQSFSDEIQFLDEKSDLVQATQANKRRAIAWVEQLEAKGETWTDTAFERAFAEVNGVDTVFFLSDGAPRRNNTPIPEETVLAKIAEANRFAKCRIHTIGFKQAGSNLRRFLSQLARDHDGTFTDLD